MKKGDIGEGLISKVSFPNKGLIITEDTRITVKNGMPGQRVRFQVNKKKKNKLEARLLEVLEKRPDEEAPYCSIFPSCGGCMYQTMPYEKQLDMKAEQIRELLDPVIAAAGQIDAEGKAEYQFEGVIPSPSRFHYRNKMEYSFGDEYKDGPLALGLHKKGSTYDVLSACDCQIVHEDFNRIVKATLEYFQSQNLPFYHKMSHEGYLRHLLLRRSEANGTILAALVTTTQSDFDLNQWKNLLLSLKLEGELTGILHISNDSLADVVKSDQTEILYGTDTIQEELLGLKFQITPFSFFQTNSRGAEVLYSAAREFIGNVEHATVFDLYSGTGTIAQVLAPSAGKVIGVEIVEEAVEAAKVNAGLNRLTNCTFLAGDVLKVLDTIPERPDFMILDPPREGIHPKALPKIIDYGADRIVYISCKPSSLAVDLGMLLGRGYCVDKVRCVDMFPGTVHVET
ncbi:MAG: 23S rRNA (uracil(1939)-C(5))-methyltransferase RlmD, partial [Lachnospiraceae bacterium]|nr:23S rRNA (uracil(1939)-C(5))-methyltransferase RlmD [Lachnospiraceae bacterium]